jgi:acyl-ACP thioesterase
MCALDLKTQRIRRIRDVGITSDTHVESPEREIAFSRLKHEGLTDLETRVVKSGDIDFVQHTNNVSYVRFIMDTYSVAALRERPVRTIEVRYAGQTHEGDILTIRKAQQDGRELFDVVLGDTVAVECEITR